MSSSMKEMVKQMFPSVFVKYDSISDDVISKCLIDCGFNRDIAENTLNHIVSFSSVFNSIDG